MTEYNGGPEDAHAQFHAGGPVDAAYTWVRDISAVSTFHDAWTGLTGEPLRSQVAQAFVQINLPRPWMKRYEPAELARQLAACAPPDAEVWARFAAAQAPTFAEALEPVRNGQAGVASRPRPLGVDTELVLFIDTGGESMVWQPDQEVYIPAALAMQHSSEGWIVIALNDPAFRPD